jgi:L-asparagine transporter-like permease
MIFVFSVWGGFEQLAILASAAILLIYLSVILATIKLRMNKKAATDNSFKVPGGLIIPVIGLTAISWLLSSLGKWEIVSTLIFMAVVSLIYVVMKWIKRKHKIATQSKNKM